MPITRPTAVTVIGWLAIAFGVLAVFSGLGALAVEYLAWACALGTIAFGVEWMRSAASITAQIPRDTSPAFPSSLFLAMGIVAIVATVIPLVVTIRVLRGRTVRDAVAGGPAETAGV
jgi:hypothetical protein